MELSPVRESDYPELAVIANGGVRRDDRPVFLINWDSGSREEIARSIAQYQWSTRANFRVDEWTVEFTVRIDGRAVGVQGVSSKDFVRTRSVSTGSWLALHEQGKGYGTQMRRTIVTAFTDHFDAAAFHSEYFEGNDASRRVSEKLGYSPNGVKTTIAQDGLAHPEHHMILAASDIVRGPDPIQVAGAEVVRRFLGLDTV
ncbi:GNAT family N-acetyltransferase [Brevibacterium sp. RIT 803]|uniref:GNAT family N-acetyltransferase n=1 Tax=Brevibacterium sp. RIT 803 TaxID=2810210 RepID=UPI00195045F8|nr:GNAT family N-acetyltransferase [Brevibacterium sp. RIT 803]MBM6590444.1 GNAT family N-acetyltransferase [Brevibacterium sp. RIT 803]